MQAHKYALVNTHKHTHTDKQIYIKVHPYAYAHTHAHTHTHTHTHTRIHIALCYICVYIHNDRLIMIKRNTYALCNLIYTGLKNSVV